MEPEVKPLDEPLAVMLQAFRDEVCLTPWAQDLNLDWFPMSIGFFLARGATPDQANDLAILARYDCQYFDGSVQVDFA